MFECKSTMQDSLRTEKALNKTIRITILFEFILYDNNQKINKWMNAFSLDGKKK